MNKLVRDVVEVGKRVSWRIVVVVLLMAVIYSVSNQAAWAGSNPISEPSFETVNNWTFSRTMITYSGGQETAWQTDGDYSYEVGYQAALGLLGAGSAELYQDVDLTDVDRIWFDAQLYAWSLNLGTLMAKVYIDDDELWTEDVPLSETEYLNESIDVSAYSGTCRIRFYLKNYAVLGIAPGGRFRFDNLRVDLVSESIQIKAQDYLTDVAEITFPAGAPGAVISNPSNDQLETQIFGGAGTAKPVVTLVNNGSTSYRIYYQVSAFTSGIVANEYYLINSKGEACTSADSVSNVFTFGTPVDTGITLGEGIDNAKDLYLKIALSNVAGKSGTSTLTILGEKP
jgi:hypothetical protein